MLGPLGLDVDGSVALVVLLATLNALLGTALGLLLSAFARSEFQAVQFLPAVVLPQLLLCGLFAPREVMAEPLRRLSDVFPLTYAVDGMQPVVASPEVTGGLITDVTVIGACILAFLGLGAATLPRRTR
jgi:ABC-2 type transport system permease protein